MARKLFLRLLILSAPVFFVAGCSSTTSVEDVLGPSPRVDAPDLAVYSANYFAVRSHLLALANLYDLPPNGSEKWEEFIKAGVGYVNDRCGRFINAISRYERKHKFVRAEMDAFQTATREVLAEVTKAARIVNLTAAGFNLATRSLDNFHASAILVLPSEAISTVEGQKLAWQDEYKRNYKKYYSSTEAMNAIASYLALCLPENIEATMKSTLQVTRYEVINGKTEAIAIIGGKPLDNPREQPLGQESAPRQCIENPLGPLETDPRKCISVATGKILQAKLCVAVRDAKFGGINSRTRQAIGEYQKARQHRVAGYISNEAQLFDINSSTDCSEQFRGSTYEKFRYEKAGVRKVLHENLAKILSDANFIKKATAKGVTIPGDLAASLRSQAGGQDTFKNNSRQAIELLQRYRGLKQSGTIDDDLSNRIDGGVDALE